MARHSFASRRVPASERDVDSLWREFFFGLFLFNACNHSNVNLLINVLFWAENDLPIPLQRRLMRGNSAVMTVYDYALVENTKVGPGENPIVACGCLHAVPGYYGSVPIQFGKPEVFATHPGSFARSVSVDDTAITAATQPREHLTCCQLTGC